MTETQSLKLGDRMERLEQRVDSIAGDVTAIRKAIMGDLASPGGIVAAVTKNTAAIEVHETRLTRLETAVEPLEDWIQDRSTVERLGKWLIGGGLLAIGTLLGWLISLAGG